MTATDELRRMLTERGVEWWPMHDVEAGYHEDRDTEFLVYGCKHVAHEWGCRLQVDMLTPRQVVEATLGRGTCHMEPATFPGEQLVAEWHCTACDEYADVELLNGAGKRPRFCPWCGAEVVE